VERLLRVVLTGAESTGKTTLATDLAAHYGTAWSPEFARAYVDGNPGPLALADVEPIARGQIRVEDEAARRASRLLILDTDLLSTVVYSRHYYGACPEWVEKAARRRLGDLYLLHHPDVPWVADGAQRDRPQAREHVHASLLGLLEAWGARRLEVRGPWTERRVAAITAIDALRGA
jgi:NadR type nicotinamide-nucleotide adenylyltransferase